MGLAVITPPAALVSVEEAKKHLNVTHADDDGYIETLVVVATQKVEDDTSRRLMSQELRFTMDGFPCDGRPIVLPVAPIASIDAVKYIDVNGVTQTWDPGSYIADLDGEPCRLSPAFGKVYPTPQSRMANCWIEFTAGVDDAADVKAPLLQAVLLTVANFYENRAPVITGTIAAELPMNAQWLMTPYRLFPMAG